ncbi:MAG: hypothetical protein RL662_1001 [Bacteroidota bacterium]|jgi:hypothetical protein
MAKSNKAKKFPKHLFLAIVVLLMLGGVYYYFEIYSKEINSVVADNKNQAYTVLENKDSTKYVAVVLYNENVNINSIARSFYKSEVFWPYIYIVNKEVEGVKENPLDIPKGAILKIPRLDNILEGGTMDTTSIYKAKSLADSILHTL